MQARSAREASQPLASPEPDEAPFSNDDALRPASTRNRIMDAAERLFGSRGVDGSSLRGINSEAGTNAAAIHYHFGSKKALVEAVIDRRMKGIAKRRIELLDALEDRLSEAEDHEPGRRREIVLVAIAESAVLPLAELIARDPMGGGEYVRFIARLFQDREPALFANASRFMRSLLIRFDTHLGAVQPDLEPAQRHARIILGLETGVSLLAGWTSTTTRAQRGAGPNHDAFVGSVISFVAGGLGGPNERA